MIRVGISWGAGKYAVSTITGYTEDGCIKPTKVIKRKKGDAGACELMTNWGCKGGYDVGNPCFWKSVKAT